MHIVLGMLRTDEMYRDLLAPLRPSEPVGANWTPNVFYIGRGLNVSDLKSGYHPNINSLVPVNAMAKNDNLGLAHLIARLQEGILA